MATGIVSVGLHLTGFELLSRAALVLAAAAWLLLVVVFESRFLHRHARWLAEADSPTGLTGIAATTVLGTRLSTLGWNHVAAVALILAAAWWPVLLGAVVRHWERHLPGAGFLVCVATQGLTVLAATLAHDTRASWLAWPALAWFVVGCGLYPAALARFDLRQIRSGAGDQWVFTGALAITALAGSRLADLHRWGSGGHTALMVVTVGVLGLNWALYLVLLAAEVVAPRPKYDIRRWATVFPLGMTAAASLTVGAPLGLTWLDIAGKVLLAIAVASWLTTVVAMIREYALRHLTRSR